MKITITFLILLSFNFSTWANHQKENRNLLLAIGHSDLFEKDLHESLDTIIKYQNYQVRCKMNGSNVEQIGINLFNDNTKTSIDKEMLDYVETALLATLLGFEMNTASNFTFHQGEISDLKYVSPDTPCKISNQYSRSLSFEWYVNSEKILILEVPINYYIAKRGSRSEIEEDLINRIKSCDIQRNNYIEPRYDLLVPYKDGIYILKGQNYLNNDINRNLFFSVEPIPTLIMSSEYPEESMANLFISPQSWEGVINANVQVLKHEYAETELFKTKLESILAVCEAEGCIPYWGVENYNDGMLSGSLFLYNWKQGYTHVLKVECIPEDILNEVGDIDIRASLFVPTNNIQFLFEPIL